MHLRRLLALAPIVIAACLPLAGCDSRAVRRDAAVRVDTGPIDAGAGGSDAPLPDAFTGLDADGELADAVSPIDALSPMIDAPSPGDAFVVLDAATTLDAAARDAFVPVDALAPRDAFVPVDAFSRDAYVPRDAPAGAPTTFAYTGALASYVVPAGVTSLRVVALGASGGDANTASGSYSGGHGAQVEAVVTVTPGETLSILVGQRPDPIAYLLDGCGASGGGGTFVVRGPSTALVVAGAGGGASAFGSYVINGQDASLTAAGASSSTVLGGTGGAGGQAVSHEGGGGGGLTGDGASGEGGGGLAFTSGGAGGARATTESCGAMPAGGFGGGGGGGNDLAGGGGGYSGGAAQADTPGQAAGGGGSFVMGTTVSITVRTSHGHGSVTITPM